MKSGNYYVLVTPKGEEIKKAEFRNYSVLYLGVAEYIDLQSGAEMFTRNVSTKGLVLSNGRDDVASIAKALDVSIKSLFEDPVAIEGFVSVGGKVQRFSSREEFERIVNRHRQKMNFTLTSTEDDDEDDMPF